MRPTDYSIDKELIETSKKVAVLESIDLILWITAYKVEDEFWPWMSDLRLRYITELCLWRKAKDDVLDRMSKL